MKFLLDIIDKQHSCISRVIIAVLSIACITGFVFQFVQCCKKFSNNPEHSEIKYKPSRNQPFPAFTLCPLENSSNIFEDLQVQTIDIRTYSESKKQHIFQARNWTVLDWKVAIIKQKKICFTFTIPADIIRDGIEWVGISAKAIKTLHLNKLGTLTAPVPVSILSAKFAQNYQTSVTHEAINLLTYEGIECDANLHYNYDECKLKYICKVC